MNQRSIIQAPEPNGQGTWLDTYIADNQLAQYQPQQQQLIDVDAVRGILFRQRWLIGAVILAAAIGGIIFTLLATPMYRATATVKVEPYGNYIVEGQDIDTQPSSTQVDDHLATQMAVIESRKMASTVAADLNLGERYDLLGKDIDEGRPPNMSDEEWLETKEGLAAEILQAGVSSEFPEQNYILTISYSSPDPVLAAEIANGYSDAFVMSDSRASLENNEYAQEFLLTEIEKTRTALQEAELAANAYARNSGIIVQQPVGEEGGASITLTNANLANVNARFSDARTKRIEAEQRWRAIENLPASQLPEVQANPVLQNLVSERTVKQARLIELRQRYNDEFPEIANLLNQIEVLDRQIAASSADIKATVRNEYVVARRQEQALEGELDQLAGATLAEQDLQVQYGVLKREADALRNQLKALLDRYNAVSSAANVQTGELTKLDAATVPNAPYSPNLARNMLIALVFGVALAGGLAVLRETLDDRIRSLDQVEEKVGLPPLGSTPFIEERDLDTDGTQRFDALMEAYASIRSSIDFALPRERNVLQMTSSQASEGKSTTSVILAELFASMGRKTLLIDADLRRPSVNKLFDIEKPKVGFVEVLLGHAEFQSAVVKGIHENLDILPIGDTPPNPTEILASSQLRDFIEWARKEYSLVIIDSSPIIGLADAPLIARLADATIFVLEANRLQFGQVKAALRRLRSAGGKPLGIILTKYRALQAGQSYDYQYAYYDY